MTMVRRKIAEQRFEGLASVFVGVGLVLLVACSTVQMPSDEGPRAGAAGEPTPAPATTQTESGAAAQPAPEVMRMPRAPAPAIAGQGSDEIVGGGSRLPRGVEP